MIQIIYHIFKADAYFHTIDMIDCIIKSSKLKNYFIVVGTNEVTKTHFNNLFEKNNYTLYEYISEKSSSKKTILISKLFHKYLKTNFSNFEIELLNYIDALTNPTIILHSNYSTVFYFLFSRKKNIKQKLGVLGFHL